MLDWQSQLLSCSSPSSRYKHELCCHLTALETIWRAHASCTLGSHLLNKKVDKVCWFFYLCIHLFQATIVWLKPLCNMSSKQPRIKPRILTPKQKLKIMKCVQKSTCHWWLFGHRNTNCRTVCNRHHFLIDKLVVTHVSEVHRLFVDLKRVSNSCWNLCSRINSKLTWVFKLSGTMFALIFKQMINFSSQK